LVLIGKSRPVADHFIMFVYFVCWRQLRTVCQLCSGTVGDR